MCMVHRHPGRWRTFAAALLVIRGVPLYAQETTQQGSPREILAKESYIRPPAEIERLVTAPREKNVTLTAATASPDRHHFFKLVPDGMPTVQTFGKPHYYLGGLQVDYRANRSRALTDRGAAALEIVDALTGKTINVEMPKGATASAPVWSPDGTQLAFIANFDEATHLYVADVANGKARRVTKTPLLATLDTVVDWTADGKSIVAVLLPDNRKPEPKRPEIETGPLVRMTNPGEKDKNRNYASLLRDPYEKDLLEYYTTGQLAVIDGRSGAVKKIGQPAMFETVSVSPDGQYYHVTIMQKPFSYLVQWNSFGTTDEIWGADGRQLALVERKPLRENGQADGGAGFSADSALMGPDTAKRALAWMPNGQGLYYLQREAAAHGSADSSDAPPAAARGARAGASDGAAARRRDRLGQWLPPFGPADTKLLYESDSPISAVLFSDDAKTAFIAQTANGLGQILAVDVTDPSKKSTIVRLRGYTPAFALGRGGRGATGAFTRGGSAADSVIFYTNPGQMMAKRGNLRGEVALLSSDGQSVYFTGTQYFKDYLQQAPRVFVDKYDIRTGTKARVLQAPTDAFVTLVAPLDDDFTKVVVTRESPKQIADSYLEDVRTGQLSKLTNNVDYTPEFTNLLRKRIQVTRPDGYHFVVRLTLPSDYKDGTRLPTMFWFYPYEYTDQAGYDRTLRTENVNAFPQAGPRTIEYLATQGYAVANFDPPIVGESGRMNDNYVSDLVADLYAVIDELDRDGYIDRSRLGIGGHSYGAFSTLNAMTHTPFFKAGIAGDGMYNRSLTPNGFQSERRDFWQAQKTYLEMSPFLYADKLTGALLMYHSIEDQNVGTDPISSIRMMQALEGLGKTAALYMYPYEDHGPLTQETVLDQWARWVTWLDLYVKNAGKATTKKIAIR